MDEWQVDPKTGQRFRMVGNLRVWETLVSIDGTMVPESEVSAYHARAAAETKKETFKALERPKLCPFSLTLMRDCQEASCALYNGHVCALTYLVDQAPTVPSKGRICPFSALKCSERCALFANRTGCIFTAV